MSFGVSILSLEILENNHNKLYKIIKFCDYIDKY